SPHLARQVAAVAAPRLRLDRRTFLAVGTTLAASTLLQAPRARGAVADLDFVSALAAARAIRRGEVSSVELTTRMLDRIRKHNPRLNAIVTLTADAALARAMAADEARALGSWCAPVHTVPSTVNATLEI